MKIDELRGLSVDELRDKETGLRKELMQLRFQSKTGKLEQKSSLRLKKRDIARVLTAISEIVREDVKAAPAPKAPKKAAAAKEVKAEKKPAKKAAEKKEEPKAKKKAKS